MAYPNFPSSWSAPTTCFESTNIWAVILSIDAADITTYRYFFGVPATTPTGDCLPPSYSTSVPYIGQTCPPGYRIAVASRTILSNQQAQATLCCPGTDYSFSSSGTAGCATAFTNNNSFIATFTNPTNGEQTPSTFANALSQQITAFGITIISTSSHAVTGSPGSSDAVETNTGTSPSSSRLSAGAAAGIGIGAGLGVILVILASWIMYRRRGKKTSHEPVTLNADVQYSALKTVPSPGISSPENGPGIQSPSYQPRQFETSLPTAVYGQHPPELPS
ncbi:hypothetical protein EV127DRAFT_506103 [Xylaria flabelliformis]|nr:hypothetical protein EV127DRAFT_506103 [Xylaria flabelliformis]